MSNWSETTLLVFPRGGSINGQGELKLKAMLTCVNPANIALAILTSVNYVSLS